MFHSANYYDTQCTYIGLFLVSSENQATRDAHYIVIVIRIEFHFARVYFPRSYRQAGRQTGRVSSITSLCSSDYQEFPIPCMRSPGEYREFGAVLSAFLFFGYRELRNWKRREKLAKRELWIRESRVQTRRYFLSPCKRFYAVLYLSLLLSFLASVSFVAVPEEVACKLAKWNEPTVPWLASSSRRLAHTFSNIRKERYESFLSRQN